MLDSPPLTPVGPPAQDGILGSAMELSVQGLDQPCMAGMLSIPSVSPQGPVSPRQQRGVPPPLRSPWQTLVTAANPPGGHWAEDIGPCALLLVPTQLRDLGPRTYPGPGWVPSR